MGCGVAQYGVNVAQNGVWYGAVWCAAWLIMVCGMAQQAVQRGP
jgi:hypothetical protein